jgi:hypothetical protein
MSDLKRKENSTVFLLVAFFSTLFLRSLMTKRVVKKATSKKTVLDGAEGGRGGGENDDIVDIYTESHNQCVQSSITNKILLSPLKNAKTSFLIVIVIIIVIVIFIN